MHDSCRCEVFTLFVTPCLYLHTENWKIQTLQLLLLHVTVIFFLFSFSCSQHCNASWFCWLLYTWYLNPMLFSSHDTMILWITVSRHCLFAPAHLFLFDDELYTQRERKIERMNETKNVKNTEKSKSEYEYEYEKSAYYIIIAFSEIFFVNSILSTSTHRHYDAQQFHTWDITWFWIVTKYYKLLYALRIF